MMKVYRPTGIHKRKKQYSEQNLMPAQAPTLQQLSLDFLPTVFSHHCLQSSFVCTLYVTLSSPPSCTPMYTTIYYQKAISRPPWHHDRALLSPWPPSVGKFGGGLSWLCQLISGDWQCETSLALSLHWKCVNQSEFSNAGHDPQRWYPAESTASNKRDVTYICRHNEVRAVDQWRRRLGVIWNAHSWLADHVNSRLTM